MVRVNVGAEQACSLATCGLVCANGKRHLTSAEAIAFGGRWYTQREK